MQHFASGAGRSVLALALIALAACVDEQEPFAPRADAPQFALGDVVMVTNTNDSGIGSLRWAVAQGTGGEIVRFDPALAGATIALDSTVVTKKPLTIEGPATRGITISGGGKVRVFDFAITGTTTLRNLSITGGYSSNTGPAITTGATLIMENSTVYGNKSPAFSAIYVGDGQFINSTVSGNTSTGGFSAILVERTLDIINTTIAYNSHGGVSGAVNLRNAILSNNGGSNCEHAAKLHEGRNLSDDSTCGTPGNTIVANAQLAALADMGGPSMTHALVAASPAVDAGTSCTVQVDQRHIARDALCDLGAFEYFDGTIKLTIDASVQVNPATGWAVVTGTVQCSREETFDIVVELKQNQRTVRARAVVEASGGTANGCGPTARPWSAALAPSNGAFQNGAADATASTANTPAWGTPVTLTRQVKLFWGHK